MALRGAYILSLAWYYLASQLAAVNTKKDKE